MRRVPKLLLSAAALTFAAGTTTMATGTAQAATDPPCTSTKVRACVDVSANEAWLMKDGVVTDGPYRITSGRPGYETDIGTFEVTTKDKDHVSSIYHSPMPYSVFFNGGEAFHQGDLDVQSHGCVHLGSKAAPRFYDDLDIGDVVQVHS